MPDADSDPKAAGDFDPNYGSYTAAVFNSRFDGNAKRDPKCGACAWFDDYAAQNDTSNTYTTAYTAHGGYTHRHAWGDLDTHRGTRPQLWPVGK
jgi:hypothetical protein